MNQCIICGLPLGQKKSCPRCKEAKRINGKCTYCQSIYNSTPASYKRKYKYCPMCGDRLEQSKFKKWSIGGSVL